MAIGPYLTTVEVAEKLSVHPSRISHFVKEKRLSVAQRFGTAMLFWPKDVEEFNKQPRKAGRPPKQKKSFRRKKK